MNNISERLIGEKIITKRTILRNFKPFDIKDLYEYCSQDGVGEMAGWQKHESIDYSMKVLNNYIQNKNIYAVVYKENNKVIGHVNIQKDLDWGSTDTRELGYVLNKNYWNNGIMTEVVKVLLKELFEGKHRIGKIYVRCCQDNIRSKRLIEKCGFKFDQEYSLKLNLLKKVFKCYKFVYTSDMWLKNRNIKIT